MQALKILLYVFSFIAILSVLLPFIKKDFWAFRVFDYPRLQKFTIIGILSVCWFAFFRESKFWLDLTIMIFLSVAFFYLLYLILPFTFLGKKMIDRVSGKGQKKINLLVANIYQYNDKYQKLLDLVKKRNPDVVFLVETDKKWLEAVQELREDYPHFIEIPLENTYGLLFYSRLPIKNYEINYLIDEEIPSIIADLEFYNQTIRVFGLHPTPPVPQENEHSTDRDAEILLIGKMAKEHEGPCVVIGDLNDVAWSYTTKLFLKTSELLDPRRGRGMYSTFHAKYPLLRWPLDHYFVSSHFRLVDMKVEKHIDSDHFPISICLVLSHKDDEDKMQADQEDNELVEEKIEAGLEGNPL
ncbi:endonuclease/exonuclease/phosphatase family protein [Flavobacterium macacae]|uniref:Endonuclease/exonuclease/phosphatase family protein n=1 Tax=Flavobacterium macacae TaxID=2488993 RepID=A0A3P3WIP9_9FLAO|nr:endonuclease/exonuclease/phosphatase family protein [Flavobacterium macacae]RRJ93949.1 endonuclease/exonuclease/phosphatase family protein [Flavobacterium macacae]